MKNGVLVLPVLQMLTALLFTLTSIRLTLAVWSAQQAVVARSKRTIALFPALAFLDTMMLMLSERHQLPGALVLAMVTSALVAAHSRLCVPVAAEATVAVVEAIALSGTAVRMRGGWE